MTELTWFFQNLGEHEDALIDALDKMNLSQEQDGFLYTIRRNRQILFRIYVVRFQKPHIQILHNGKTPMAFVQIEAEEKVMDQVLSGKLDPIKAAMSGQVRIKGNIAFVMRHPKQIQEFFKILIGAYQNRKILVA